MKTIDARIKTIKKGQMTYYRPQLRLGWWIFKQWSGFQTNTETGYLQVYIDGSLYGDYDKAMETFEEYKKLTNNDYRMTHPRPIGV